MQSMHVIWWWT